MANWSEKCLTCRKAESIAKWGWIWPCAESECKYEPCDVVKTTIATTYNTNTTKNKG